MIPYLGDWQAPDYEPHVYKHGDKFLPSVTTILDRTILKPHLDKWKDKKRKEYFLYHWTEGMNIEDLWEDSKKWPLKTSLDAADWGTAMHQAMQELLQGEQNPLYVDNAMEQGCEKAWGIFQKYGIQVIQTETAIYAGDYAGTMDLLCEIDDNMFLTKPNQKYPSDRVVALIDFKSTIGHYYKSNKVQLAGYSLCKLPAKPQRFAVMRIERELKKNKAGELNPCVCYKAFEMKHWLKCWQNCLQKYLLRI